MQPMLSYKHSTERSCWEWFSFRDILCGRTERSPQQPTPSTQTLGSAKCLLLSQGRTICPWGNVWHIPWGLCVMRSWEPRWIFLKYVRDQRVIRSNMEVIVSNMSHSVILRDKHWKGGPMTWALLHKTIYATLPVLQQKVYWWSTAEVEEVRGREEV